MENISNILALKSQLGYLTEQIKNSVGEKINKVFTTERLEFLNKIFNRIHNLKPDENDLLNRQIALLKSKTLCFLKEIDKTQQNETFFTHESFEEIREISQSINQLYLSKIHTEKAIPENVPNKQMPNLNAAPVVIADQLNIFIRHQDLINPINDLKKKFPNTIAALLKFLSRVQEGVYGLNLKEKFLACSDDVFESNTILRMICIDTTYRKESI